MVPPWAIGASRTALHGRHELPCLGGLQGPPQLLVGGVGVAVPQVEATVPANRYGFCGTSPMVRVITSGSRSRTSTPSRWTLPSVASNSRGTSPSSVDLPLPVEPMTAVVRPGRGGQRDVTQHGRVGAGVAELHAPQLQQPPSAIARRGRDGHQRRYDTGPGVQHLLDALGAHLGPRHHHEHEGGHHHGRQNLHQIAEETRSARRSASRRCRCGARRTRRRPRWRRSPPASRPGTSATSAARRAARHPSARCWRR